MANDAGTAYISVDPDLKGFGGKLSKGVDPHIDKTSKDVESKLGGAFKKVAGIAGGLFLGGQALSFGKELVALGTKVDTFGRKAQTVFEGSNADVQKWADTNASAFGVTDDALSGLAANFGDLLKPMGFTSAEAAKMSTEVVGLSGALSAWSGGQRTASEVSDILAKAMLGERDSLKELGISISEADVQGRLLSKGQKDLTGAALEQAKAVATQELIFEKSTDAQKAWADGSFDAVKKQNALREKIGELKEDLAAKLLPAYAAVIGYLVDKAIPGLERFGGSLGTLQPKIRDFVKDAFAPGQADVTWLDKLVGGVRAATAAFKAGGDEVTSSGFAGAMERIGLKAREVYDKLKGIDWESIKSGLSGIDWNKVGVGASIFGAALGLVADHSDTLIRFLPLLAAGFVAVQLAQAANNTVGKNSIIGFGLQTAATIGLAVSNRQLAVALTQSTLATSASIGPTAAATAATTTATAATTGLAAAKTGLAAKLAATLGPYAALTGAIVLGTRALADHVPAVDGFLARLFDLNAKIPIATGFLGVFGKAIFGVGKNAEEGDNKMAGLNSKIAATSRDWLATFSLDTGDAEQRLDRIQARLDRMGVQASARELAADSGDIVGPVSSAPSAPAGDDTESLPDRAHGIDEGPLPGPKGKPLLVRAHGGEWVVTPEQMEALRSGRSGGAVSAPASVGAGGAPPVVHTTIVIDRKVVAKSVSQGQFEARRR